MNGIRRKLRSQRGVTVVFALVIFLIMALFSYVMVNASLTAVQGTYAGQFDQQAYLSTRSVAFLIRDALEQYPEFTVTNGEWKNTNLTLLPPAEKPFLFYIARDYIPPEFNNPSAVVWQITGPDHDEAKEKFGVVKAAIDVSPVIVGACPAITIKLEHWDYDKTKASGYDDTKPSNYKMTVTITATTPVWDASPSPPEPDTPTTSVYGVTFKNATMTAQQGVS